MNDSPDLPAGTRTVREAHDLGLPALVHHEWTAGMPWLVQGTTTRGSGEVGFDLGLFSGASPERLVRERWNGLLARTGATGAVHARQVHEAEVRLQRPVEPGLTVTEACDGHVTDQPGVLLAVTVADCVPVFVAAEEPRAVAVLHAGWRGAAAGVLERGLGVLSEALGASLERVVVHLGPSICAACYEVGPEVFAALGQDAPADAQPIDLRGILARRAVAAGVPRPNITVSSHCTRCTDSGLFSHRGGDGQRQVGYIGIRS